MSARGAADAVVVARNRSAWSAARAEEHLLSLELFGMSFGLERMGRLLAALGAPQQAYPAVHVVGTNGKSSTARMTAALLEAHGLRTGTFTSPHLRSFAERIRLGDRDLEPAAFGAAVGRVAEAAAAVEQTLDGEERVTQFELLTATALVAFADAEVDVAVVEAGLGGRLDATNVLDAPVVVLTNVSLEHTRWLGPTEADIAREKLSVVRLGATLVVGALPADVEDQLPALDARVVRAAPVAAAPGLPGYQRENFAVARAAAEAHLGTLDAAAVAGVAERGVSVPGRLERIGERPLTLLDGAHNPGGMATLAAALPETIGARPLVAVLSALEDKDAVAMLAALVPHCAGAVLTASRNPRALAPDPLASRWRELGGAPAEVEPDPHAALTRARVLAGPEGAVLATGSIYLVADLLAPPERRRASAL